MVASNIYRVLEFVIFTKDFKYVGMQTYLWFGGMYFADVPGLICYWLMVTTHVKELGDHIFRCPSHNCSSMLFPVRAEESLRGDVVFKTLLQIQTTDTFRISRWAGLFMTCRNKPWEPLSSQDSESWEISKCYSGYMCCSIDTMILGTHQLLSGHMNTKWLIL